MNGRIDLLTEKHPQTMDAQYNYACLLHQTGQYHTRMLERFMTHVYEPVSADHRRCGRSREASSRTPSKI